MKARLAARYARALFRIAAKRQILYEVAEELTVVEQIFSQPEVKEFFNNPGIAADSKADTIGRLFGTGVSGVVQNFLYHMTDKRRTSILPDIIKIYRSLVKQAGNILEVEVITAMPLNEPDKEQLAAQLAAVTEKTIELHSQVDSRILGGLIIQIGDKRIDNSVTAKLAAMKKHILEK
ncbi:ATP synthase subunit delta [Sporomusa rhizae]|uniref:ATP synthase F1 subunit delta n=1 Tax=Sporomusa rhizae TaxID=357999 RepID=UPI00352BB453